MRRSSDAWTSSRPGAVAGQLVDADLGLRGWCVSDPRVHGVPRQEQERRDRPTGQKFLASRDMPQIADQPERPTHPSAERASQRARRRSPWGWWSHTNDRTDRRDQHQRRVRPHRPEVAAAAVSAQITSSSSPRLRNGGAYTTVPIGQRRRDGRAPLTHSRPRAWRARCVPIMCPTDASPRCRRTAAGLQPTVAQQRQHGRQRDARARSWRRARSPPQARRPSCLNETSGSVAKIANTATMTRRGAGHGRRRCRERLGGRVRAEPPCRRASAARSRIEHRVVHRQPEQDHEREQRQPVDDPAEWLEAQQRLRPVILEDGQEQRRTRRRPMPG